MNILTITLNRVYLFLTKVKNQSPFFGAIFLVALLINTLLDNLITFLHILNDKPNKTDGILYYSIWMIITILIYFYAKKRKNEIIEINSSFKSDFLVVGIFLFTLISFIWCANINREKLAKDKSEIIGKQRKESLEGKIKKLFE